MNCLARLGCLIVLVLLAAALWLTRGAWLPMVGGERFAHSAATPAGSVWQPLTRAGAARTRAALDRLSRPSGPVFTDLSGADAASYIYEELAKQLPPSADSLQAAVLDDRLCLRASVKLSDLGGPEVVGPLASFLGDRNRMQFCGTFDVIRPGLAEYRVKELRLHDIALPTGAIPRLLTHVERGSRPPGTAPDGLPLLVPRYLRDVRVANGKVTLYKGT